MLINVHCPFLNEMNKHKTQTNVNLMVVLDRKSGEPQSHLDHYMETLNVSTQFCANPCNLAIFHWINENYDLLVALDDKNQANNN